MCWSTKESSELEGDDLWRNLGSGDSMELWESEKEERHRVDAKSREQELQVWSRKGQKRNQVWELVREVCKERNSRGEEQEKEFQGQEHGTLARSAGVKGGWFQVYPHFLIHAHCSSTSSQRSNQSKKSRVCLLHAPLRLLSTQMVALNHTLAPKPCAGPHTDKHNREFQYPEGIPESLNIL